jgi:chromosome partitioning protein
LVSQERREFRLKEALEAYGDTREDHFFHYIFVDTPPSLGILTINAFAVANEVLIPIQCEYYALEGMQD